MSPLIRETPYIHDSLLDTDLYQFFMLNFIFWTFIADEQTQQEHYGTSLRFPQPYDQLPNVTYSLTHRPKDGTKLPLAEMISEEELRFQLDHVASLSFTPEEITYLGSIKGSDGQPIFKAPFLAWLRSLRLSPYTLTRENGDFAIKASGPWPEALLWETFVMNTLTELLTARLLADPATRQAAEAEARQRLMAQLAMIADHPELLVFEFGTRRRAAEAWQNHVITEFIATQAVADKPRSVITSNVKMARKHRLESKGTMAHQLFIVISALLAKMDDEAGSLVSQQEIVKRWWQIYGFDLSIWLPDTFTTGAFLANLDPEIAKQSKGFRQDSGDPDVFAQKIQTFYKEKCGLTDAEISKKVIVFSDGLTVEKAIQIWERWHTTFTVAFGIGTSLTNDLGEFGNSQSLVMKPETVTLATGEVIDVLKLSDDPAKITGKTSAAQRMHNLARQTIL